MARHFSTPIDSPDAVSMLRRVFQQGSGAFQDARAYAQFHAEFREKKTSCRILQNRKKTHYVTQWMLFLRAKEKEEFMQLAQENPDIAEAWEVVQVLSADDRVRAEAEAREKAYMDYDVNVTEAHREGLQKGRQEGRQEEKPAVAVSALRKEIPVSTIAEITGSSIDEVNQIAAGLTN
ncbi:MAG: PD-(D/E)XK nuclease family transposase [Desulfovibrio sp.]|nr:PD-(D/E)XK nuclease family transposase [Desulfovibrio sp.]